MRTSRFYGCDTSKWPWWKVMLYYHRMTALQAEEDMHALFTANADPQKAMPRLSHLAQGGTQEEWEAMEAQGQQAVNEFNAAMAKVEARRARKQG